MKIAVINFSGNVGKTTVAKHLLLPRIPAADLVAVESVNTGIGDGQSLRGRQFGELQEFLQTVDNAVVDIGASNVEDLLSLMHRYHGSHKDFDCFVVPTVAALKQQQDTTATLLELDRLGVEPRRVRLLFNMIEDQPSVEAVFRPLLEFLAARPVAQADIRCQLGINEVYQRVKYTGSTLLELARDDSNYKVQIASAATPAEKLALAQRLATQRLARGVVPELDACFAALDLRSLVTAEASNAIPA
jgi:hypothetical protein